jgi:hypothetical protein
VIDSREDRRVSRTRSQRPPRCQVIRVDGKGSVDGRLAGQSTAGRTTIDRFLQRDAFSSGP